MSIFSILKIYNHYFIRFIPTKLPVGRRKIRGQKSFSTFRAISRFSRLPLLLFLLLTSYFLLFFSCSFLTNPEKTTVSGLVKLKAQTDHNGVKVSLYKLVDLDTTLVRIHQQYPNIGIQISQETEFYHREQMPVYTTTNKDGKWEIKDVAKDNYNIVAEKAEFGFTYLLNQIVENNIKTLTLNKVIYLTFNFTGSLRPIIFTKQKKMKV